MKYRNSRKKTQNENSSFDHMIDWFWQSLLERRRIRVMSSLNRRFIFIISFAFVWFLEDYFSFEFTQISWKLIWGNNRKQSIVCNKVIVSIKKAKLYLSIWQNVFKAREMWIERKKKQKMHNSHASLMPLCALTFR